MIQSQCKGYIAKTQEICQISQKSVTILRFFIKKYTI